MVAAVRAGGEYNLSERFAVVGYEPLCAERDSAPLLRYEPRQLAAPQVRDSQESVTLQERHLIREKAADLAREILVFLVHDSASVPRSYMRDEGRSLEVGLQEQASNPLKLLW
jgi:hypothetical protein